MAKRQATVHDQEEPQSPSRSRPQAKVVLITKDTKKPARQKKTKNTTVAVTNMVLKQPFGKRR